MAKTNVLGAFIRNKRKEVGFPDVTSFARHLSRSVSYVSRVEIGNSDGPSLRFLGEVAQALKVDVKRLVKMKELDDASDGSESRGVASPDEGYGGVASDSHLGGAIRYSSTSRVLPLPMALAENGPVDPDRPGVQAALRHKAKSHRNVAKALAEQYLWQEAMDELLLALAVYERLEDWGGVAFSCFSLGRAFRRMVHAVSAAPSERLRQLMEAADWFARAYAALTQAPNVLADEYRERLPECIAQWARVYEQIADLLVLPDDETGYELDDAVAEQAREELRQTGQKFYRASAHAKREAALAQYTAWIESLKAREQGRSKSGGEVRQSETRMIAEAYQRLGVLLRDLAYTESEPNTRMHLQRTGIEAFRETLHRRRELASGSPDDPQITAEHVDRLGNAHGELGLSLLLYKGGGAAEREEAYWQFRVARKLYDVLGLDKNASGVDYVDSHLVGIQAEYGLESDIIARQEIEDLLAQSDFGTKEHPIHGYPLLYRLDTGRADDGDPAEGNSAHG